MTGPGVNADGVGGIDLYPQAAGAVMDAVTAAGEELRGGWAAHLALNAALDSQLGNGPLGRAIAGQYNEAVANLREGIDAMTQRIDDLGRSGGDAVRMYATTDQRTGQHYNF